MRTQFLLLLCFFLTKSEQLISQAQSTIIANTFILSGTKTTSIATGTNTVTPSTTQLATTKATDTMIKEAVSEALDLVPGIAKDVISVTTIGSGGATYNSSTGVINVPIPSPVYTAAIHDSASRSLNSNYTISSTNSAFVTYSISVSVTLSLVTTSGTGTIYLEYSTNSGST